MFLVGIFLGLTWAEICLCPTADKSSSSDYWSSSESIMFCSPEVCESQISTTKFSSITTTVELTTTCVAVPTVEYTSRKYMSSSQKTEVCFKKIYN